MNIDSSPRGPRLMAACAIGLAVWALRIALVADLGTGIPFWDQWDREGLVIYEPWLRGDLSWSAVFEPHLEHRIVWTHLWNLGLFKLCGQWDPMVQMVAQAGITAVTAGFSVWSLLPVRTDWFWRSAILAGGLITFGAPFAYGNILWGFQSSFALLVMLSVGLCVATSLAWENARYSWLALCAGLAAPLAMGAGALVGPIVIVLTILVTLTDKKFTRRDCGLLAVGLICLLWGQWLRSGSTVMMFARAETASQFGQVWLAALAWPNCRIPWLAGLACLPTVLLVVQVLKRKARPHPHELFLIGVALWATGCAAGGAWTRGGLDRVPPSRYHDFLAPLCWANLLAMVLVLHMWWERRVVRWRLGAIVSATIWIGVTVYGAANLMNDFFKTQRPTIQLAAGRQVEAVNSVLAGASVATMINAGLQNRPSVLGKVMTSKVLAPYLPPELQAAPANLTPEGSLAIGLAGPHDDWKWRSERFEVRMSAMTMFVRGEPKTLDLELVNASGMGAAKASFVPSGRRLGDWSEWLVRNARGYWQLEIRAGSSSDGFDIIFPRPVSAAGYWARRTGMETRLLVGLAGVFFLLAVFVVRNAKEKGTPFSRE